MRTLARFVTTAIVTCVLTAPSTALATPDASNPPTGSGTPALEWQWQPFRVWEYPLTAAALGAATFLRFAGPRPAADWTGGVLVDDWVHDHTAIQSIPLRDGTRTVTDVFFYGSMVYRLVDSAVLPALVWRSPNVAFQMSMIDLESFGFVAITLWGGQAVFGRERPFAKRCSDPAFAASEQGCGPGSTEHNRSFFAGHPAVVLTAAGLTCTHHAHLPLFGGGAADIVACAAMLGAAVVTGIGRVITEEHYVSDLVVGYGAGFIAGFVLPELLHYGSKKRRVVVPETTRAEMTLVRASLVPQIGPRDLGLGLRGVF